MRKCKHTILELECKSCISIQQKWYSKLKDDGFIDIESGRDRAMFTGSVIGEISESKADYFDCIWSVYHAWQAEGRRERDLVLAELLADQYESTGTVMGIVSILKSRKLKPNGKQSVQITIKEIKGLVNGLVKTGKIPKSPASKLKK